MKKLLQLCLSALLFTGLFACSNKASIDEEALALFNNAINELVKADSFSIDFDLSSLDELADSSDTSMPIMFDSAKLGASIRMNPTFEFAMNMDMNVSGFNLDMHVYYADGKMYMDDGMGGKTVETYDDEDLTSFDPSTYLALMQTFDINTVLTVDVVEENFEEFSLSSSDNTKEITAIVKPDKIKNLGETANALSEDVPSLEGLEGFKIKMILDNNNTIKSLIFDVTVDKETASFELVFSNINGIKTSLLPDDLDSYVDPYAIDNNDGDF